MKGIKPKSIDIVGTAFASALVSALFMLPSTAHAQDGKTYVMKLSTATVNDTQHEWMKRFAAAVEKDSGGRIKGEIYPASQLGAIPRQIEGTQFGSIQGWVGPPEFLVGVDERYEVIDAPGLYATRLQAERVLSDPPIRDMVLGLGANKGLIGGAIFPIGPSWILTRKPVNRLADYKGLKIRVLASRFQEEIIRRMDASPVAMTLADVLPALQGGTIDGTLTTITQYTTLHYVDAAKYVVQTDQPFVNTIAVLSKKWVESLPPDLQKIVHDDAAKVGTDIFPFVHEFFDAQIKVWTDSGGQISKLSPEDQAALNEKAFGIPLELSKDKPDLNQAVKLVMESAARNK